MESTAPQRDLNIPAERIDEWQSIVETVARLIGVPAGLIMRVRESDIEVFVSSRTDGNPYTVGDREHLEGSGLYCETVIKSQNPLLVPNALADDHWKDNPDVALGMISYLGYPINYPDGQPFGTLCVLDAKQNAYTALQSDLLAKMRDLVQSHLALIYMNAMLHGENLRLVDYIEEMKVLRGLLPICAGCKKIRDHDQYWHEVEAYVTQHSEAEFTHSLCPACIRKLYPGLGA